MAAPAVKTDALFRWIEEREKEHFAAFNFSWGRVLDSGTGRHSLLASAWQRLSFDHSSRRCDGGKTFGE
uniref:Uncharacterized protein n=1 Tax=Hyaloperonospora arabidopsidis (strain Emoy2) TaxID=559515 RepID=M4BUV3_HYAAE